MNCIFFFQIEKLLDRLWRPGLNGYENMFRYLRFNSWDANVSMRVLILRMSAKYWPSWERRGGRQRVGQPRDPARWRKCRRCACTRQPLAESNEPRPRHPLGRLFRRRNSRHYVETTGDRAWCPFVCKPRPRWTTRTPVRTGRYVGRTKAPRYRMNRTCI